MTVPVMDVVGTAAPTDVKMVVIGLLGPTDVKIEVIGSLAGVVLTVLGDALAGTEVRILVGPSEVVGTEKTEVTRELVSPGLTVVGTTTVVPPRPETDGTVATNVVESALGMEVNTLVTAEVMPVGKAPEGSKVMPLGKEPTGSKVVVPVGKEPTGSKVVVPVGKEPTGSKVMLPPVGKEPGGSIVS